MKGGGEFDQDAQLEAVLRKFTCVVSSYPKSGAPLRARYCGGRGAPQRDGRALPNQGRDARE
jgi:hypothetical protein